MNKTIKFSFAEWLSEQEQVKEAVAARVQMPHEEIGKIDQIKMLMDTGDVVELPPWKKGDQPTFAQIVDISGNSVQMRNFITGKVTKEPFTYFVEIPDSEIPTAYRNTMRTMGANKMWRRLTKSRIEKEKRRLQQKADEEKAAEMEKLSQQSRLKDTETRLKRLFKPQPVAPKKEDDPIKNIFNQESVPHKMPHQPLARFRTRAGGGTHPALAAILNKPE